MYIVYVGGEIYTFGILDTSKAFSFLTAAAFYLACGVKKKRSK